MVRGRGQNGFGYSTTAEEVTAGVDLTGQRILVTGCNSGLGLETARVLSLRGATVLGTARDRAKAESALRALSGPTLALECELSEPDSVSRCVDEIRAQRQPLAAIIANAGIMALPQLQQKHGLELQFLTNHVGHFILVTGLVDLLSETGRVVMVSSSAHRYAPKDGIEFDNLSGARGYSAWKAYGQSKLANLLFAKALARRLASSEQAAIAIHPGVIATNLGRHMNPVLRTAFAALSPLFLKNAEQGAATQCYAAVHPEAAVHNGEYLADCNVGKSSRASHDMPMADKLWDVTDTLVAKLRKAA
jgi:NAD(P)-dependent dehydrogenase (short-subunit alcohol dehydrogenase family)